MANSLVDLLTGGASSAYPADPPPWVPPSLSPGASSALFTFDNGATGMTPAGPGGVDYSPSGGPNYTGPPTVQDTNAVPPAAATGGGGGYMTEVSPGLFRDPLGAIYTKDEFGNWKHLAAAPAQPGTGVSTAELLKNSTAVAQISADAQRDVANINADSSKDADQKKVDIANVNAKASADAANAAAAATRYSADMAAAAEDRKTQAEIAIAAGNVAQGMAQIQSAQSIAAAKNEVDREIAAMQNFATLMGQQTQRDIAALQSQTTLQTAQIGADTAQKQNQERLQEAQMTADTALKQIQAQLQTAQMTSDTTKYSDQLQSQTALTTAAGQQQSALQQMFSNERIQKANAAASVFKTLADAAPGDNLRSAYYILRGQAPPPSLAANMPAGLLSAMGLSPDTVNAAAQQLRGQPQVPPFLQQLMANQTQASQPAPPIGAAPPASAPALAAA